jgi:2-C-methyl-D-erythritol 4-phosphate cytidylyltransferase
VIPVDETLRKKNGNTTITVPRNEYMIVQTPQVFQSEVLQADYNQPYSSAFTDDASVVEKAGYLIHLIEGNRENIKITTPHHLKIAETLIDLT